MNEIIQQCLNSLKREDVKKDIKRLCSPFVDLILYEMRTYIYAFTSIIVILVITNLAILLILIINLIKK